MSTGTHIASTTTHHGINNTANVFLLHKIKIFCRIGRGFRS